jgi:hypothetical protein
MAENPSSGEKKRSGWLKAIVGTLAGLLGGALVTYLTPLVDKLVKPAKPLANFATEAQGLAVTCYNRSSGGSEGWWDFGDGSQLVPVSFKENTVSHTYARPGGYTVKLSLRNYIGEESDRAVPISLEGARPEGPAVVALTAVPVRPDAYAPATFRISTKVQHADLCVFHFGDNHPMRVVTDPDNAPDRMVTFKTPGNHIIRVLAVQGKKTVERTETVRVNVPPPGMTTLQLTVTYHGTLLERKKAEPQCVHVEFPPESKEKVFRFEKQLQASPGFLITEFSHQVVPGPSRGYRNVGLKSAPDQRSLLLTGELVKPTGLLSRKGGLPNLVVHVSMTQERRSPAPEPEVHPISVPLNGPGSVLVDLPRQPDNWVNVQPSYNLSLEQEGRVIWQEAQLPRGAAVLMKDRPCQLTATVEGNKVRVDLTEANPAVKTVAGPEVKK